MYRIIKYVLDTKSLGLKIKPSLIKHEPWNLESLFCDSNYAGDPDTRYSISSYMLYVPGVPICWQSNAQCSIR